MDNLALENPRFVLCKFQHSTARHKEASRCQQCQLLPHSFQIGIPFGVSFPVIVSLHITIIIKYYFLGSEGMFTILKHAAGRTQAKMKLRFWFPALGMRHIFDKKNNLQNTDTK